MRLPSETSRAAYAATPSAAAAAGLMALAVAMGIGRFAFTPILPLMQEDAALTTAQAGWLAAANYLGYFLGALWATAQPARSAFAIRAALLAIALATLGMGLPGGFAGWLALRAIAGIASAWALIHVSAWCLERLASPLLAGAVYSGVGCGIALAGGLCLALMRLDWGSAQAWVGLGALSLAVTALVWPMLGPDTAAPAAVRAPRARLTWTADRVRLVACYGTFGFGYIIPATFVPVMARRVIQDPAVFGWAWPVFGLAAATSTLCVAALGRRLGQRRTWAFAAAAMAAAVAAPVLGRGLDTVVACAAVVGGTFMVITMAGMQEARRVGGGQAAVLMGAMTAAFAAGQVIGPLSVTFFVGRQDEFSAALVLASGLLMASAIVLAIKPK